MAQDEWTITRDSNGRDVYTLPNGSKYEGAFADGQPNGHGILVSPNGNCYEGEFVDGVQHGHGIQTWLDTTRYEGEFAGGHPHGHGVKTWPDGLRYEGEFRAGNPHGDGVVKARDGSSFEGKFINGLVERELFEMLRESNPDKRELIHQHSQPSNNFSIILFNQSKILMPVVGYDAGASLGALLTFNTVRRMVTTGKRERMYGEYSDLDVHCKKLSEYAMEVLIYPPGKSEDIAVAFICTGATIEESMDFWEEISDGKKDWVAKGGKKLVPVAPWVAIDHHPALLKKEHARLLEEILGIAIMYGEVTIKLWQEGLLSVH